MLYISNAGLGNGISRELVFTWMSSHQINLTEIVMLEQKPFCFVEVACVEDAERMKALSGTKIKHEGIDEHVEHHIYYVSDS